MNEKTLSMSARNIRRREKTRLKRIDKLKPDDIIIYIIGSDKFNPTPDDEVRIGEYINEMHLVKKCFLDVLKMILKKDIKFNIEY